MRPHRNPGGALAFIRENEAYLAHQSTLPVDQRQPDFIHDARLNLSEWAGWGRQPDVWWGGVAALPVQWGGQSRDFDDESLERHMQEADNNRGLGVRQAQLVMNEHIAAFKKFKPLNLEKLKPGDPVVRDITLPPFKVDYDQLEQINTKLLNTVIMIKDNPFYVLNVYDLGGGAFGLRVHGLDGNSFGIEYKDVADCRPIAPGYVSRNGSVYWLHRGPERQNQQGMNHRNTFLKAVNTDLVQGARHDFLLSALANRKDTPYNPVLDQMLVYQHVNHLRLSNNVALFFANKKGAPIGVEYCGRNFGLLTEGGAVKVLDECDLRPTWIHNDLRKIGLAVRA